MPAYLNLLIIYILVISKKGYSENETGIKTILARTKRVIMGEFR